MLEDKHFLLVMKISKGRVEQCNYFPWARISAYIDQGPRSRCLYEGYNDSLNLDDRLLTENQNINGTA